MCALVERSGSKSIVHLQPEDLEPIDFKTNNGATHFRPRGCAFKWGCKKKLLLFGLLNLVHAGFVHFLCMPTITNRRCFLFWSWLVRPPIIHMLTSTRPVGKRGVVAIVNWSRYVWTWTMSIMAWRRGWGGMTSFTTWTSFAIERGVAKDSPIIWEDRR